MRSIFTLLFVFLSLECFAFDAWFVDGRCADLSAVKTLDSAERWTDSSLREFLQTQKPEQPVFVYVHGNDTSIGDALSYGQTLNHLTKKYPSFRLVIWGWDADKVFCRIRKDISYKVCRSRIQEAVLASFLERLKPNSQVTLAGFSLGAVITSGALQSWDNAKTPLRMRMILLSAALDCGALSAAGPYSEAAAKTEGVLVYVNQRDPVLRFYPWLNGCGGPPAVGRVGISLCGLPENVQEKIELLGCRAEHNTVSSLYALSGNEEVFQRYVLRKK